MIVQRECLFCTKPVQIHMDLDKYLHWLEKTEHVQNIFPELSPAQQDFLLTGVCSDCWNEMFNDDEPEETLPN